MNRLQGTKSENWQKRLEVFLESDKATVWIYIHQAGTRLREVRCLVKWFFNLCFNFTTTCVKLY